MQPDIRIVFDYNMLGTYLSVSTVLCLSSIGKLFLYSGAITLVDQAGEKVWREVWE